MVAAPKTKPGTRRLSEVAKHLVVPSGIVSTGWPAVRDTCNRKLGVEFDGWQDGAGRLILSKRVDGKLAVMIGGVGMSLPRQVGKTYLLAGLIFGLCVNQPGLLVVWSAHHARTHGETFLAMQGFAKRPKVRKFIQQVFVGSGDEEIRFTNGSRILFGARERGFGRGIAGVDALVLDEGQILSEKALENMLATLNVSQFGLLLMVGTPPTPDDVKAGRAEAFTRMRSEALSGESQDSLWIECGADDNADPDDWAQVAKANPSFPHRTPRESILRMRKKLSADGNRREGLGLWDSEDARGLDVATWVTLQGDAEPPTSVALVVDVAPDRKWSSIGVASECGGRTLVMAYTERGTAWVVPKVVELAGNGVVEIAITPDQARALKPDLTQAGVEFHTLTRGDVGASCGAIQEAIKQGTVVHVGQPELDAAVTNAQTRMVGEVEQWDRRDPGIDISPIVACSAAFYRWGLLNVPVVIL